MLFFFRWLMLRPSGESFSACATQRNGCWRSNSRTTHSIPPNPTLQPRFWERSVVGTVMFLGTPGKPTKPLRWRSWLRLRADSHRFVTFWPFLFKCFGSSSQSTQGGVGFFSKKSHAFKSLDFLVVCPIFGHLGCRNPKAKKEQENNWFGNNWLTRTFLLTNAMTKKTDPFFLFWAFACHWQARY